MACSWPTSAPTACARSLAALLDPGFTGFPRPRTVKFAAAAGMTEYSNALKPFMSALFPPEPLSHVLGEIVSAAGLKQLRIAETEKYAHVTFFLNGGEGAQFPAKTASSCRRPR